MKKNDEKNYTSQNSSDAYSEISHELGERQQFVLDGLAVLGCANNRLLANHLSLGINQVTARMYELRDLKYVTFSHNAQCPISTKATAFWKLTKHGEANSNPQMDPKIDYLIMKPFITIEGDTYTRFSAQIKSSNSDRLYNVEVKAIWNNEKKDWDFENLCDCKAFEFRFECKHCEKLIKEVKAWDELKI